MSLLVKRGVSKVRYVIPDNTKYVPAGSTNDVNLDHICSPLKVLKVLLWVAFSLLAAHVLLAELGSEVINLIPPTVENETYREFYYLIYKEFHLGFEFNIPTYFSVFLLAVASYLLHVVHHSVARKTHYWNILRFIFLFLMLDELLMIHEMFGGYIGNKLNNLLEEVPPFLSWAWMVPYTVLAIAAGGYFLRFTLKLPAKSRNLFFVSGAVYVFAALGLEFFEAHFDTLYGPENMMNKFLFPLEEVMEMVGVSIFIYALLDYLMRQGKKLRFSLSIQK